MSYPVGTRVDVWWPSDKTWYAANIRKTRQIWKASSTPQEKVYTEALCEFELDGVIQWETVDDQTLRVSNAPLPSTATEDDDVEDIYPRDTKVDVWWPGDRQWYSGTVLTTRVMKHGAKGRKTRDREIYVDYLLDGHMQYHSLHNNKVRKTVTGAFVCALASRPASVYVPLPLI